MNAGAHFTVKQVGDIQVIELSGAAHHVLDIESWSSKQALYGLVDPTRAPRFILDLHKVAWAGSRLLAVIMQFNLLILRQHGKLRICGLRPEMKEVLEITRLSSILSVHPTLEDAIKDFD